MEQNIAIVESGLLGIMLALCFAKKCTNVTLFESSGKIGGTTSDQAPDLERLAESLPRTLAAANVEMRLNSPVQTVEKIGNGKLKITLQPARRRSDPKPARQTKYSMVNTAFAVTRGFSGGFLTEPQMRTDGIIQFPRQGLLDVFDKVIVTCDGKTAANIGVQLTIREKEMLELGESNIRPIKTSVDGLFVVTGCRTDEASLSPDEIIALADTSVRDIES